MIIKGELNRGSGRASQPLDASIPMKKKTAKKLFYIFYGILLLEAAFVFLYPSIDYLMTDIKLGDTFGGDVPDWDYCIFENLTTQVCYNDTAITITSSGNNFTFKRDLPIGVPNETN